VFFCNFCVFADIRRGSQELVNRIFFLFSILIFNFFLAGVWKMDWEPRDKEMDERRSSHRLARIQHHLRPGLPLCSPGKP
jgi:hypothetical protein